MTLGSLFDGIGGWLIAAQHAGVKPIWASEIDDFPAAVTAYHFPDVVQLGDITKINVNDLEPVDIICAGSPCQDLSVAGKREGLSGERSGLFRTAIKLVHGLRERTGKPRYFVWENVPGAFSSNKGHDFRAVLEEITKTEIPMPKDNKWADSGMVEWDGGSLAWRVLDAQYWGVPQRRKRIFLVAGFGVFTAGEILFEREGVSGDTAKIEGKRQDSNDGFIGFYENHGTDKRIRGPLNISPTVTSRWGTGGNNVPLITQRGVRRIMPVETERLQGLPDGYTDILFNGKPAPDSRRYKALGNGMAQPCADFVIQRIAEVGNSKIYNYMD